MYAPVTFGGQPCLDPVALRRSMLEASPPLPVDWWGRANRFDNRSGHLSGTGGVLMLRRDLLKLDLNTTHDLEMVDHFGKSITHHSLHIAGATVCLNPSSPDNDNTAHFVPLADNRRRWLLTSINRGFNLRVTPTGDYATSTATDEDTPYTATEIKGFLWDELPSADSGVVPDFPGDPEEPVDNLAYWGWNVPEAFGHFLSRCAYAWVWDSLDDEHSIVELGAEQQGLDAEFRKLQAAGRRIFDLEPLSPAIGTVPSRIEVYFRKSPGPRAYGQSPFFTVGVAAPDPAGDGEGGTLRIDDDLLAEYQGRVLQNEAALNTRAEARASQFFQERRDWYNEPLRRTYSGYVDTIDIGSRVAGVSWMDTGYGPQTVVELRPAVDPVASWPGNQHQPWRETEFVRITTGGGFDAISDSGYETGVSGSTHSHTTGSGADRFLAVDVAIYTAGVTVSGITYDGVAMTLIGAQNTTTDAGWRIECWGLVEPAEGANDIVVTLSGNANFAVVAASYTGINQASPTEAFNSAQATNGGAADATVNITTVEPQSWIHAALSTSDVDVTASRTARNEVNNAAGTGANEDHGPVAVPAATAMGFTAVGAGAKWAIAGYALRPANATSDETYHSGRVTRWNPSADEWEPYFDCWIKGANGEIPVQDHRYWSQFVGAKELDGDLRPVYVTFCCDGGEGDDGSGGGPGDSSSECPDLDIECDEEFNCCEETDPNYGDCPCPEDCEGEDCDEECEGEDCDEESIATECCAQRVPLTLFATISAAGTPWDGEIVPIVLGAGDGSITPGDCSPATGWPANTYWYGQLDEVCGDFVGIAITAGCCPDGTWNYNFTLLTADPEENLCILESDAETPPFTDECIVFTMNYWVISDSCDCLDGVQMQIVITTA